MLSPYQALEFRVNLKNFFPWEVKVSSKLFYLLVIWLLWCRHNDFLFLQSHFRFYHSLLCLHLYASVSQFLNLVSLQLNQSLILVNDPAKLLFIIYLSLSNEGIILLFPVWRCHIFCHRLCEFKAFLIWELNNLSAGYKVIIRSICFINKGWL